MYTYVYANMFLSVLYACTIVYVCVYAFMHACVRACVFVGLHAGTWYKYDC